MASLKMVVMNPKKRKVTLVVAATGMMTINGADENFRGNLMHA